MPYPPHTAPASPRGLEVPLPPEAVAADPSDYEPGTMAHVIACTYRAEDGPIRLDREPAVDDLFQERDGTSGLPFLVATLRPGYLAADLSDPRLFVDKREDDRALRRAQSREHSHAARAQRRRQQRELERLQLRAALVASPDTPVTSSEVAKALGLRIGDVRRVAPPLTMMGRKRVAPFRAWAAALDLEVFDGTTQSEQAQARRGGRGAAHGHGEPGLPAGRPLVLAGPEEGRAGHAVDGLGDPGRGHGRRRQARGSRPAKPRPLGGPRRPQDGG